MSTSGTITFNETRDQIITNALSLLNVVAAGETVSANEITFGASLLNAMIKAWMAQGIHLYTEEIGTLFIVPNQTQYILSSTGTNASDGSGTPVETVTTSNTISGGTSIVCANVTGMTIGDTIGVCLDNNTIFWTTIQTVNTTSLTVGLNSATTNTAALGNTIYTYTSNCPKVLSIQAARLRNVAGFDREMKVVPRNTYMRIPEKTITGPPIIISYSPQVSFGTVYIWPASAYVTDRIEFTYLRILQDFDNASDNPDLPQEWLEALTFNLAIRLAPAYGINLASGGITGNPNLLIMAAQYLKDLQSWDTEQPYVKIIPKGRF